LISFNGEICYKNAPLKQKQPLGENLSNIYPQHCFTTDSNSTAIAG
jgi:hypothetical protein